MARWLLRRILRLHPSELREAAGTEIVWAIEDRVRERRRVRGRVAAWTHLAREAVTLAWSAVEARRELGGRLRLGSASGPVRAAGLELRDLGAEAAIAVRLVQRAPGPGLLVVAVTALGVGVGGALLGLVHGPLVRPVPLPDADRLVEIRTDRPWLAERRGLLADIQARDLRGGSATLESAAVLRMVSGRVLGGARVVHADVARTSATFFDVLGVEPLLGRTFRAGEDRTGAPWVAVLSHRFWVEELDADPQAVGRRLIIGWQDMEIIGVLPKAFRYRIPEQLGDYGAPDLWIPWWHHAGDDRASGGTFSVVARTRPGRSASDVESELAVRAAVEDPRHYGGQGFGYAVEPLGQVWVGDSLAVLRALAAAALALLVLTTASVSATLAGRSVVRSGALAVRRTLGASRWSIARLILTETMLLVGLGAALGVGLAASASRPLAASLPGPLSEVLARSATGSFVTVPLAVAGLVSIVVTLLVLVAHTALRPGQPQVGRSQATGWRRPGRLPRMLLAVQVAVCAALLVGAGLVGETVRTLAVIDLGFEAEGGLAFSVYLMNDYPDLPERVAFHDTLRARLGRIDGVSSVGATTALPLSGHVPRLPVSTSRRADAVDPRSIFLNEGISVFGAGNLEADTGPGWALADVAAVQPGYFEAVGIALRAGRRIEAADRWDAQAVVVVDETLARSLAGSGSLLGGRLWIAGAWREVIGVARHARQAALDEPARPQAYLPYSQINSGRVDVVVRSDTSPPALAPLVRDIVAGIDPLVPIGDVVPLRGLADAAGARERFASTLFTAFAGVAVLLVGLSLYGLLAAELARRRVELALRRAVGAPPHLLAAGAIAEMLRLAVVGGVVGVAASVALAALLSDLLHGVRPAEPSVLVGTAGVVVVVVLAGTAAPVARAVVADAAQELRAER